MGLKKLISFILAGIIFASGTVFASGYTDVARGTKIDEAVSFFEDMGLIEGYSDGMFRPDMVVNRADFAIMLAAILGYGGEEYNREHFSDVPKSSEAFGSIEYLYSKGLIEGTKEGIFSPDEKITGTQGAKMLLLAIGYAEYAEALGGYPAGYEQIAETIGIYKGISNTAVLTRGSACLMLFNALNAEVMSVQYRDGAMQLVIDDSRSLLNDLLGFECLEGIVIADSLSSVYGDWNLKENEVIIDYERYTVNGIDMSEFVGSMVRYYKNEDNEIYAVYDISKERIAVDGSQIEQGTTSEKIYYDDGKSRVREAKIAPDAYYVYNGRNCTVITDEDFEDIYGELTLVYNDSDDFADVVFIWDYTTYTVDSYISVSDKLFVNEGEEAFELEKINANIIKDGEAFDPKNFAQNDIVSLAFSKDNSFYTFIVSKNAVSGRVDVIDIDEEKIIVGEKEYKIAESFDISSVKTGEYYEFYLDFYGNIAYAKVSVSNALGYLYFAALDDESGGEEVFVKIFNESGKFERYFLAEKVKVTIGNKTENYKNTALLNEYLRTGSSTNTQMIRYEVNAGGRINKMSIAKDAGFGDWDDSQFLCNMDTKKAVASGILTSERATMYNSYLSWTSNEADRQFAVKLNNETKIFYITNSENTWKVLSLANYSNGGSGAAFESCKLYDISETGYAGTFLVYSDAAVADSFSRTDPIMVIGKLDKRLNDDDEECYSVSGFSHIDGEVSYYVDDAELESTAPVSVNSKIKFSQLKRGDVIQVIVDNYGKITSFRLLHSVNDKTEYTFNIYPTSNTFGVASVTHGFVYFGPSTYKSTSLIYKNTDEAIDNFNNGTALYPVISQKRMVEAVQAVVFHTKTNKYEVVDNTGIFSCDNTFLYSYPGYGQQLVVLYD